MEKIVNVRVRGILRRQWPTDNAKSASCGRPEYCSKPNMYDIIKFQLPIPNKVGMGLQKARGNLLLIDRRLVCFGAEMRRKNVRDICTALPYGAQISAEKTDFCSSACISVSLLTCVRREAGR